MDEKYVTKEFCDERFTRIMEKLDSIDRRLEKIENNQRESLRDWKRFVLTVLGGVVTALIVWLLNILR
jgi:hypothetical protein